MLQTPKRLTLRLPPDNPIFELHPNDRGRKADEWMRIGATVEKLEKVAEKLERILNGYNLKSQSAVAAKPTRDERIAAMDNRLIQDILSMGGSNND